MENQNNRKEALRKRIEQVLKSRDKGLSDLSGKTIEEVLEEVSIYHQELEFQNLELLRIQEDLEETEKHYEELFNNAPIGYVLIDANSIIHSANTMFAQLVNKKPQELKSQSLTSFIHPDHQDQYYLLIKKVLKEKGKSSILVKLNVETKELFTKLECNIFQSQNEVHLRIGFIDVTSEVVNEKQLIDSRERYRAVADYAYHWEYWQDPNGKLLYMSPSCERITGYSKYDFFENPNLIEDIIHPDDRHKFDEHKSIAIIPGKTKFEHTAEYRITRKDGEVRWIGHACLNIFKEDGTHIGLRATNRDITERKRTREELKQKLELLNQTQQIANIGSWELNVETNELIWSNEIYRIFGLKPQQFKGSYDFFLETIHPDDREEVNAAYINSLRDDTSLYEIEHRIIRKDNNEVRYVYEKCYHERDNTGKVIHSVGMVQDITERKLKEQKLVVSDRVFNHAVDMLCIAGFDGYFKTLNPSWEKTLGWSAKELMAKPWIEFVHMEDRDATKHIRTVLVDGEEIYQFENRYVCKDGTYKWLSWNSYPYPGENIIFGVARDVTFKKQSEERLRNSELQLKDQNEELTALNEELNQSNEELRGVMEELHESNQRNSALVAANPDVMFVYNRKGVFLDYHTPNPKSLLLKPNDFIGKAASEVLPEFLAKINQNAIDNLFKTKQPQHYSYSLEVNGSKHHFDARMVRYGEDKALAIVRDITEKKVAEERLRLSQETYLGIINSVSESIYIQDEDGVFLEVNNAAIKSYGLKRDNLVGKTPNMLSAHGKNNLPLIAKMIKKAFNGEPQRFEFWGKRADGTVFPDEVTLTCGSYFGKKALIAVARNISERKQAEQELQQSNNNISFLADRAISFININTLSHFYSFIAESMQKLNPSAYILVNSVNMAELCLVTQAVVGPSNLVKRVTSLLGYQLIGKQFTINQSFLKQASGELVKVEGGIYEFSQGNLSKSISKRAQELLGINNIYGVAVLSDGKIVANVAFIFTKDNDIANIETIEAFIKQAAMAYTRIKAKEELANSEQRFQLSMEATNDGLWDWNIKTDEAYYSPAFYRMLGYQTGDFPATGQSWRELLHPDDKEAALKKNNECIEGATNNFSVEFRLKAKNGEWRWMLSRGKCVERDKKGKALRVVGTHVDITERKEIEETVRQSQQLLQTISDNMFDLVSLTDLNGNYTFAGASHSILGYEIEELIGTNVMDYVHPDDFPVIKSAFEEFIVNQEDNKRVEYRNRCADGTYLWFETVGKFILDKKGNPKEILFNSRDITERKSIEEALAHSHNLMKYIIEHIRGAVAVHDRDLRYIYVSQQYLTDFNIEEKNIIGKHHYEVFPDLPQKWRDTHQLALKGKVISKEDDPFESPDGSIEWSRWECRPWYEADGTIGGIIVYTEIITKRKKAEQALRENEEKYRTLFEANTDGIAIFRINPDDTPTQFIEANSSAANMLGYSIEEFIKLKMTQLEVDVSHEELMRRLTELKTKGIIEFETKLLHKKGHFIYANVKAITIKYLNQPAILNISRDITEGKKAEQALRESEEMMRNSQSVAHICSYSTNLNENEIEKSSWVCSPEFYKIFGIDKTYPHTIEGWARFIHPDYREEIFAYHESVVKEKKSFNREYKIIRINDGAERWVLGTGELEYDEQGAPVRMHGAIQDITERKKAEQTLRESEERFRMLAELAPVGIIITDKNQNPAYASPIFTNIFGYTINDIPTVEHWFTLAYPNEKHRTKVKQEWFAYTEAVKKEGSVIPPLEYPVRCMDGSIKQIEFRLAASGKINVIIFTDITERKKAEQALRESEERFRSLYENATVGIYRTTPSGDIIMANPTLVKMLGYNSLDELKKRNLDEEGYEPSYSRDIFQEQIEQNGEVKALESAWKVKGGSTIYISESARLIADSKGKPLYYEGIVEDITESKKAIDALKASEERISSIFRVAPTGIGVIKNRVFVEVNPRLCEMTGYSADELIGQSARMIYPTKEEFEYVGTEKYRQIAEKGTGSVETRWIRKDGTIIEVILSSTPIFKADLSKGVTFTALDITKRKQSEKLMQARVRLLEFADRHSLNELFMEMLAEAENLTQSQIGFYHFINQDKGEITLNQWSEQTQKNFCNVISSFSTHYPIEQAGIWVDCVHKRKPQIINNYNDLNRQDKLPKGHAVIERTLTVPVIRKRKVVAVLGIGNKNTPYNNNDIDAISQLADLAWEIAEKKLAEEEVAKLSKGIEQSPAIVVITNTNGTIEYVNPKFTKVTGYSLKEAIGKNPRILNSGNQSKAFYQNLWDTINSGKDWQGEMLNKKKDGETYWESALISPIKDERGKTKHFIAIKEDITQRKTIEKDLKEKNEEYLALNEELIESNDRIKQVNKALVDARKKAEESDKLKTAFLANMSHEIRTPMNSIIGFSEFLLRPNIAREKQEFFARILNTSCQQLLSVVNDIIDISKIETQQMDIHREVVNINKSITRIKEIFIPQAKQHNVTIIASPYWNDNRAEIITDQAKTDQILTNLVNNAIKFTEAGTVEIGYTLKDRFIEFFVKDTGIGISPEHHELIFERFQQVEMDSTRKYGGTGLGLPICKAFVEMLGGKIWLNSDLGKGTTIYFTLPYIPSQEIIEEAASSENKEEPRLNGKNILIAEDEMANILYLRELIEDTGANVIHAENGKEAVDIALNNPNIDLILMDIKMPVMNGVDATKLIKEHTSKIPIIALTAYAMSGDKDKYLKAGCDGYLSKPVVGVEVISMLNDFLKKPKKK